MPSVIAFDFISGSGSAFSLHLLVKMKAVHAHTRKEAHALHLHCRWEEAAHSQCSNSHFSFWTMNRQRLNLWCAPKGCRLFFFFCLSRVANKAIVNTSSLKSFENIDWIRICIRISIKVGSLAYDLSD